MTKFSDAEVIEVWDRWQAGDANRLIGRDLGRSPGSIRAFVESWGGVRPRVRRRSERHLSLDEREEISRGVAAGDSLRIVATRLGRAPSTISRELAGMRRGELCGFRWTDVDLVGDHLAPGRISVVRQYAPDGVGGFQFGPPKSKQGHRLIDLDPSTVAVLKKWKTAQLEQRVEKFGLSGRPELVFGQPEDGPLRPDSGVSKAFDRILKQLDVPRLSIHGLRHTHCCHLVAAGMDLKAVSARMGHASVSFTLDRYAHLLPGQQAHVAATVADLVDSVSNM